MGPYGSTGASSPELGLVQDFIKYWITEFVGKCWDVIVSTAGDNTQDQFNLVNGIFVNILEPEKSVLPSELTADLESIPADAVNFVSDQTMVALMELQENPAKRFKK